MQDGPFLNAKVHYGTAEEDRQNLSCGLKKRQTSGLKTTTRYQNRNSF